MFRILGKPMHQGARKSFETQFIMYFPKFIALYLWGLKIRKI